MNNNNETQMDIESINYAEMVRVLAKPGEAIQDSLTPVKCHLLHMVVGVAGEAGELLDAIKKHVVYNKSLDFKNVIEELGDIEFYLEGLRQKLGIPREATLIANKFKLADRYKGLQYSDKAAQDRADKVVQVPCLFPAGGQVA